MSQTTEDLKQHLNKSFEELKTLRDDIKVRLHLASLDAKKHWDEHLEPRFAEAEKHVREAGDNAKHAVGELLTHVKKFSASLGEKIHNATGKDAKKS